jgi:hypothetical protein
MADDQTAPEATCPSSTCRPGNLLLGIIGPDGTLAPIWPVLAVDESFVSRATAPGMRVPEARFRFAGPCVTSACRHWVEQRCQLGDAVARAADRAAHTTLSPCAVRANCRWWNQSGAAACRVCPTIVHTPTEPAPKSGRDD